MSDNEDYAGDDGDAAYDVFAQEDDEPQMDEPPAEETADDNLEIMHVGDAEVAGGGGLRAADDRITTKYMTKYERARILGTRALQIRWVGIRELSPRMDLGRQSY